VGIRMERVGYVVCVLKRKDISGNKNGKSGVCCVCVLTG